MAASRFMQARNAAHHASQVVSAWGATHLPADPNHDYANLGWDSKLDALVGRRAHGVAAGMRFRTMSWLLVRGSEVVAERGIGGSTVQEGLEWLRAAGREAGAPDAPLGAPDYDLPAHPVVDGAAFPELDPTSAATLATWYSTANTAISKTAAQNPGSSEVRCWPHHFDLATLITLDRDEPDPEKARSVGVGMTPGDATIAQPYFYVTPWPAPEPKAGPALVSGRWHDEGWFGAVLTEAEWSGASEALDGFLVDAVRASRELVGIA